MTNHNFLDYKKRKEFYRDYAVGSSIIESEILNHEYTFPLSLYDISNYEILSKQEEISKRRWDRRVNHLSWSNHNILCDCIIKMLNGFNNFYYDDFNFKFLSLDAAYHTELVENKKGFIYE